MFDFAWSELALIGVVALVAIGPKDMPVAIKSVARLVKKARSMAGEFQTHVDELMKEADLGEVRTHLADLRRFNLRDQMTRVVDPDGGLRNAMTGTAVTTTPGADDAVAVEERAIHGIPPPYPVHSYPDGAVGSTYFVPPPDHLRPHPDDAPAFIPPDAVATERALRAAPAFIPPEDAERGLPDEAP